MGATRRPGVQCEHFFQNRRPASDILVGHLEGSGGSEVDMHTPLVQGWHDDGVSPSGSPAAHTRLP